MDEPVAPGSLLVSVPLDAMMTPDTARRSKRCGSMAELLSDWQALSLHLLCERSAGPESEWSPYIRMLPPQVSKHSPPPRIKQAC